MNDNKENLYDIFEECSYSELMNLFKCAKTKEEQEFYITLSNIIIQNKQVKVIGK